MDHEERNLRQSEAPYELVIEHGESEQMSSSEHNETTNNTTSKMILKNKFMRKNNMRTGRVMIDWICLLFRILDP
ncbi:hypothetical protein H5410_031193 [Solanum commersonii]|uniref:Uncharacterized protein n=1 Tax=Solanum commersonii TaxID=4109 RepID=A0A9J5YJ75_SOLCO|nr:hypothetical protein H5410_031193 [Solanum commersonii]